MKCEVKCTMIPRVKQWREFRRLRNSAKHRSKHFWRACQQQCPSGGTYWGYSHFKLNMWHCHWLIDLLTQCSEPLLILEEILDTCDLWYIWTKIFQNWFSKVPNTTHKVLFPICFDLRFSNNLSRIWVCRKNKFFGLSTTNHCQRSVLKLGQKQGQN